PPARRGGAGGAGGAGAGPGRLPRVQGWTLASRRSKPRRWWRRLAASRAGREVRSTVRQPSSRARSSIARVRASPTPRPRAAPSTTTSSIQARRPVGMRNTASADMPTTSPSSAMATNRSVAGDETTSASCSPVGGGLELDSWGTRRSTASTMAGVSVVAMSTFTPRNLGLRHRLGRRRADVAGRGPDDPVVGRLLEDVGAPADDPARRERRAEQLGRQADVLHDDAGVELDVGVEVAARLQLVQHLDDGALDLRRERHLLGADPLGDAAEE